MFRVGMKVACIGWPPRLKVIAGANYPQVGGVYKIRAINVWPESTKLRFEGLDNVHIIQHLGGDIEPGFNSKYFRPVVETDISIFKALLNPTPEKVLEYQHGFHHETPTREQV